MDEMFQKYKELVANTIEFARNIRFFKSAVENERSSIEAEAEAIRRDIAVLDAVLGPIPLSVLKLKPRPPHMRLSDEERRSAESTLCKSGTTLVASRNNIEVSLDKLQCLQDKQWLNDEVINFYFDLLNEYSSRNVKGPKTYLWNSFFWLKLSDDGKGYNYKSVQRWTTRRKVDLFAFDRFIVPMNIGRNHWALGLVDLKNKSIKYFDSLAGGSLHASFADFLLKYLEDEFRDKRKTEECPDFRNSFSIDPVDPPQQTNGYDCGVFTCMNAECLTSGRDWLDFDQSLIPKMRRKIAAQIIRGSIC
jgi:Ulp1 family protease